MNGVECEQRREGVTERGEGEGGVGVGGGGDTFWKFGTGCWKWREVGSFPPWPPGIKGKKNFLCGKVT